VLSSLKILLMFALIFSLFIVSGFASTTGPIKATRSVNFFYALGVGIISVFFTYGGYQHTINFGADVKDAQKNIPRAIFAAMGMILFLYLSINLAYYHALGFEGIMQSKLVAAELAGKMIGSFGIQAASIIIFVSVLGFLNTSLLTYPRIYYAMAEDKILPPVFKRINKKTQVGEFSLTIYFLLVITNLFFLETFEKIVNYVMFIDSIALASAAAAIFILRRQQKNWEYHGYKIRMYPAVPLFFLILIGAVSINVLLSDPSSALVGFILFILGYPLFLLMKKMNFK
jgi:APA family basic amino acid/polyamine antiporter